MELLHGADLRNVLEQEGILPLERILRIGVPRSTAASEQRTLAGAIHRDLKPDNIFLIEPRRTARLRQAARLRRLLKLMECDRGSRGLRRSRAPSAWSSGRPAMAPRQALGHPVQPPGRYLRRRGDPLRDGRWPPPVHREQRARGDGPAPASCRAVPAEHAQPGGRNPEKRKELILACLAKGGQRPPAKHERSGAAAARDTGRAVDGGSPARWRTAFSPQATARRRGRAAGGDRRGVDLAQGRFAGIRKHTFARERG